tara:strand:- start:9637 stop:10077 length:441 start_codon:yes stop_codon:yes gene_type:complete
VSRSHSAPSKISRFSALPLLVLALLVACTGGSSEQSEFRDHYARLHHAGDVDGLLELIEVKNSDPNILRQVRWALEEETRWPIGHVEFKALTEAEILRATEILPSPPKWQFIVTLDTDDRLTSIWYAGATDTGEIRILLPESREIK